MFKTAATKIAHNSTIPALSGNQDLRPLQDLITAEKAVLISLQKLSVDYSKASEALRTWGLSEGDDLGDILSASTSILNHFSSALSQYAAHGHSMRDQLKAIRTREESLDDLKRRRRTVLRKAEDAEKKLSKMNPEHKNLVMQTDILNRLREDIRTMDSDIMSEEAALGDFKRTATRVWMGLKFGGLLECCEKGMIAGEYGKMTIAEISEESTQPGLPRSLYYGHNKVESLVAEAHRRVNEVTLSTVPSIGFRDKRQYERKSSNPPSAAFSSPQMSYGEPPNSGIWLSGDVKSQPPAASTLQDDNSSHLQTPIRPFGGNSWFSEKSNPSSVSLPTSPGNQPYAPPYASQTSQAPVDSRLSQTLPSSQQLGVKEGAVDDFGVNIRSTGPVDISNPGGRFATFPVKTHPTGSAGGYSLQDPPSLSGRPLSDTSFSASIAEALHEKEDLKAGTLSPWGIRFNGGSESSINSEGTTRATEGSYNRSTNPWGGRSDTDPPPFEGPPAVFATAPLSQVPADNNKRSSAQFSSLPLLPPGAAPPDLVNPWTHSLREGAFQAPSHSRQPSHVSDNDDALLAYMTTADVDEEVQEPPLNLVPFSVVPAIATTTTSAAPTTNEDQSLGRHVRFGAVEDVDEEIQKRTSLEKQPLANTHVAGTIPSPLSEGQRTITTDKGPGYIFETNRTETGSELSQQAKPASWRVPPPPAIDSDERGLNAAAAREVSLELEALKNNDDQQLPSVPSLIDEPSQPDPTPDFNGGRPRAMSTSRSNDQPPTATGARDPPLLSERHLPLHPYAELNPPGAYSTPQQYVQQPYQPPPVSPAQAYAQSYQQQQQQSSPYAHPQASDMWGTLPPRLQALNNMSMDPQVPPRFQGSSPAVIVNSLPPRFQTSYTPPVSVAGGVKPDQQQRDDLAYPGPLGSTSPFTTSLSSIRNPLQARGSTPPLNINTTTRTINAAAFKRPIPRNTGSVDSDTTTGRKLLPSTPYPPRDAAVHGSETSGGITGQHRKQVDEREDDYDYISAYADNNSLPSPQRMESGLGTSGQEHVRL